VSVVPADDTPEHGAGHGATLATGAVLNVLAFLTSNLRAIFTFLVARLLGGATLGTFGVAWAIVDLASKFGTLGLDLNVMPFVARSEAAADRTGTRAIFSTALLVAVGAGLLVAAVGSVVAVTAGQLGEVRSDLVTATSVMFLAVPGIVLYRVSNGLSRGLKLMRHDVYSRGLTESLVTAGALLVAVALGARLLAPVYAAIAGTLASGFVAFALVARVVGGSRRVNVARHPAVKGLIRTSLPIAVYDLLNIGIMRIDVIMLGLYAGRAPGVTLQTIGIYAACVEVAGGLRKVSQAFTPILTPVLAEQIAENRMQDAESSYAHVARWMLAVLLPAVVVLAVSGGAILSVFGTAFHRGGVWLAVAGGACALNAFVGLGETILLIQRPAWNVINTSIAFAAAVALNFVLIPAFGPLGAALGMLVPYVIQGALRGFEITRLLKWRWPWRALLRPWGATVAALPVPLMVRALGEGLTYELAAGGLYLLAYFAIWRAIGLEPEDRAIIARLTRDPRRRTNEQRLSTDGHRPTIA
jgi:O-antigen/teichoic acid export membrane protein